MSEPPADPAKWPRSTVRVARVTRGYVWSVTAIAGDPEAELEETLETCVRLEQRLADRYGRKEEP
jgi:hypothetical protein